jgi:HAD superfamily hydrolase (TIGR01509 family)
VSGPPGEVAAVVFDLDGVLVDTEPLHMAATQTLIAPAELAIEQYEQFIGRGGFKEWLAETYPITLAELDAGYSDVFFTELEREPLEPLDGVVELLEAIGERGLLLAVASQSSRAWVDATLAAASLDRYFPQITTAGEAGADKPEPDVYLLAAEKLGQVPGACIAVEDSIFGMASARTAGMWVVQSTQASYTPPPQPSADAVVASLRDFDLGWLDGDG